MLRLSVLLGSRSEGQQTFAVYELAEELPARFRSRMLVDLAGEQSPLFEAALVLHLVTCSLQDYTFVVVDQEVVVGSWLGYSYSLEMGVRIGNVARRGVAKVAENGTLVHLLWRLRKEKEIYVSLDESLILMSSTASIASSPSPLTSAASSLALPF